MTTTLTRDDILNASKEQLDIWCAELMGWKWFMCSDPSAQGAHYILTPPSSAAAYQKFAETATLTREGLWLKTGRPAILSDSYCKFKPTTDPAAAWELWEWWLDMLCGEETIAGNKDRILAIAAAGYPKIELAKQVVLWALETGRLPVGGGE